MEIRLYNALIQLAESAFVFSFSSEGLKVRERERGRRREDKLSKTSPHATFKSHDKYATPLQFVLWALVILSWNWVFLLVKSGSFKWTTNNFVGSLKIAFYVTGQLFRIDRQSAVQAYTSVFVYEMWQWGVSKPEISYFKKKAIDGMQQKIQSSRYLLPGCWIWRYREPVTSTNTHCCFIFQGSSAFFNNLIYTHFEYRGTPSVKGPTVSPRSFKPTLKR